MRGNKFYTKFCLVIITILCLGIVGGVCFTPSKISRVQAEDTTKFIHEQCSQKYDDNVVFSVEQVYFNTGYTANEDSANVFNRTIPLYLNSENTTPITNILGYGDANNYFLNYGGTNDSLSKEVIYSGEYALLNENATRTVYNEEGTPILLNQGIMITLGGYVYNEEDKKLYTNSTEDESEINYSSKLQSINLEMKRNGVVFTDTETTGKTSLRTYNNGLNFDFVYFLDASSSNEGFYEINFTYTKEDGKSQTHSFNFYILLNSKYDNSVIVNNQEYTSFPTFAHTETGSATTVHESYISANVENQENQYPVLTYDYKHYDMKYTYTHNDLVTNVTVRFEENPSSGIKRLAVDTETNGATKTTYYDCKDFTDSDIVSFLFANVGTYEFEFNYVFYYDVDSDNVKDRLIVDNLTINNQTLNIYGYELKYAKTGFASSDLRCLSIVQNDTLVIPVNGYINSSVTSNISQDLGYMYTFVKPETKEGGKKKSGEITKLETADVTSKTTEDIENASDDFTIVNYNAENKILQFKNVGLYDFVDTDQGGLWFNLNDLYSLNNSYYIYSPIKFVDDKNYYDDKVKLEKVTTFTKTGYYFVKTEYEIESSSTIKCQYFAFRISSGVANVKLYTTEENIVPENDTSRLYSNQYTNKNVYATWDEPTTFASSQTATLYYTRQGYSNIYESKSNLLKYANGSANISLTSREYIKGSTLITDNGSYLLEVKVNGSDTKAYYYFTIDKEDIAGLEVLAISTATIGSNTIYNVARDANNNAVTYTSKAVIDKEFTFWWDDKKSGAQITGTYTYTPIIYSNVEQEKITSTEGGTNYLWLINDYGLGTTSKDISIEKPATKISTVDPNNVLTNQGIYWFKLLDEAGNEMNYMIIVDKTEAVIKATSKTGNEVISGEMLAEDVTFEWGTHKAIQLSDNISTSAEDSVISKLYKQFYGTNKDKYYESENSNSSIISEYVKTNRSNNITGLYLVVPNTMVVIDNLSYGESLTIKADDTSVSNDNVELVNNAWHNIVLKLTTSEIVYEINLFGSNQVETDDTVSTFNITLNPDKSEGEVKSKEDELTSSYTKVQSYNNTYSVDKEEEFNSLYNTGHASKDGLFVFEWANNEGTEYEVGQVYYDYYPLMSQDMLDKYDEKNSSYKYYPYDYSSSTRFTIYDVDNNVNNYEIDADGSKTMYRSTTLNAGYVLYYDETGNLVSKNATLPGMYVITRIYKNAVNEVTDSTIRKYVFFVDRNNILDYSTTSISDKIVGEHIDILSQEEIRFTNFTQEEDKYEYGEDTFKIYLQTNRLPMEIRIPTGKYASLVNNEIVKTSNSLSGKLNLTISFIDEFNLLGYKNEAGELEKAKIILFDSSNFTYQDNGYIIYSLTQDNLNYSIDNMSNIENYLSACTEKGSDWLSLPGVYLIQLTDNVSIKFNDKENVNRITIGVKITMSNPEVEMLANQVPSNENNADIAYVSDGYVFDSSKAYIRYELEEPIDTSFDAQVDTSYIYITQIENGVERVYYDSSTNSGLINAGTQFFYGGVGYNYIQHVQSGNKYVIWLDTGLEIENNKIISYKEYTYKVYIRYILNNGAYKDCYVYNITNDEGNKVTKQFYESMVTVNLDRTPFLENLENSVEGQEGFLEEYVNAYSDENFEINGNVDSNIYNTVAYRGPDGQDYYAVVNSLYYYYIDKAEYEKAENAMYAIRVNENASVTLDGTIYFRKMYYDINDNISTKTKDRRMALLPICEQYYNNVTGFATFSETSWEDFNIVSSGNKKIWKNYLNLSGNGYGYYEIIEVDSAGNMTQYLIYVAKTDASTGLEQDKSAEFVFEDVTYTYDVTFNFEGTEQVSIQADNRTGLTDQFPLIPFTSVTDMFGLTVNRDSVNNSSVSKTKDWFYKVNITNNNNGNYTYYLNYNNINLAQYIYDIFAEYTDQNYTLSLTNRYNKTLTLHVDVLTEEYNLNVDALVAEKAEDGYWYIKPNKLNFDIVDGGRYYVNSIELTDLTDSEVPVYVFTLGNDGKITIITDNNGNSYDITNDLTNDLINELINKENKEEIKLAKDREYQVKLIDCARKEYNPIRIYSYENGSQSDSSIRAYGTHTMMDNVYYSANPIEVTYNTNVYSNISIDVYKNDMFVGRFTDGFNIDNILVERTVDSKNDKNNILTFNPYSLIAGIKEEGALLRFELNLFYNNKVEKTYNIVLDNRMPVISLLNTSGEDKTNIMKVDYVNYQISESVTLDTNTLFNYVPTLTLSETVVLGWSEFDPSIYKNSIGSYYHPYLYLIEFKTKTDWTTTNLTDRTNTIMNISPKEGALGRYILVMALHSEEVSIAEGDNAELENDNLICYKIYVFNISSTANAMYEVQDSNGEVQEYDELITGQGLYDVLSATEKTSFLSKFGFLTKEPTSVKEPSGTIEENQAEWETYYNYLSEKNKYDNYIKFINQSIPLYISIDNYYLVPNGDNGISSLDFTCKVSDLYTLYIYKVYSKVHTTYVSILKVAETTELVNTNLTNPAIRFVASDTNNTTTNLVKENNISLYNYGSLFFTNFYQGGVTDSDTAKLNLVKKNRLYLEVWYKFNENEGGTVKVGTFFGKTNEQTNDNFIEFTTSGTYLIYLKDLAGNTRTWPIANGSPSKYLTITILKDVIVHINGEVPVDYNYYNSEVNVSVLFTESGYYDNGSVRMRAYLNGSDDEYLTTKGVKNNITNYTFTEYGTYRVILEATINGSKITKTVVFSIINPYESRLALDFTQISKYNITKVINSTTKEDVTDKFIYLINEGYIYAKLITYERLSEQKIFGSTMGKQTFAVYYTVNTDSLVPARECSFEFTVNNQTPSLQSSIKPGKSTTDDITIKFNAQTIFRQVGECYIEVNGIKLVHIKEGDAPDTTRTITLSDAGNYYVKIVSDSGRVMNSFKVTIKEPLNTMSIILIVVAVIVVVGVIVTFIVLRTRMKVR